MKIYSYVVKSDTGFAPNPFCGYCTLATCKPDIRRVAKEGDWVIGTGSKKNVGNERLIYAMEVTEVMSLEDYFEDRRFANKIPSTNLRREVGDNIYYRDKNGTTKQWFPSQHSYYDGENPKTKEHDLSGKNALISESGSFYYFGREAPKIPDDIRCLIKRGPAHKCNFPDRTIKAFLKWIKRTKAGIYGEPSNQAESIHHTKEKHTTKSCR